MQKKYSDARRESDRRKKEIFQKGILDEISVARRECEAEFAGVCAREEASVATNAHFIAPMAQSHIHADAAVHTPLGNASSPGESWSERPYLDSELPELPELLDENRPSHGASKQRLQREDEMWDAVRPRFLRRHVSVIALALADVPEDSASASSVGVLSMSNSFSICPCAAHGGPNSESTCGSKIIFCMDCGCKFCTRCDEQVFIGSNVSANSYNITILIDCVRGSRVS